MKNVIHVILLSLFPLCLKANEFVVFQVHSDNLLLKTMAERIIKVKVENKVEKVEKKTEPKVEEKPMVAAEKKESTTEEKKEEK